MASRPPNIIQFGSTPLAVLMLMLVMNIGVLRQGRKDMQTGMHGDSCI